jgi:hypothetical protein
MLQFLQHKEAQSVEGYYRYQELRGLGIPYSREHIRRLERDGAFPLHTKFDEHGRRIGWATKAIAEYQRKRKERADADARRASAETKRRAKATAAKAAAKTN